MQKEGFVMKRDTEDKVILAAITAITALWFICAALFLGFVLFSIFN